MSGWEVDTPRGRCSTNALYTSESSGDHCMQVFRPEARDKESADAYRMSRKFDIGCDMSRYFTRTAYKRVDQKVKPSDRPDPQLRAAQGSSVKWREQELASKMAAARVIKDEMYLGILIPKFSDMPRGQRLTPQRQKDIKLGAELLPTERDMFFRVLSNREAALAWDFSEMSRIRPEVAPPQRIETIEHEAWQISPFKIPRVLESLVIKMFQERLNAHTLEYF